MYIVIVCMYPRACMLVAVSKTSARIRSHLIEWQMVMMFCLEYACTALVMIPH
jgi:hypothetical protein